MYGFIALPVCRSVRGRVETRKERQRTRTESAWLCGPALPSWSRQTARCGVPGVPSVSSVRHEGPGAIRAFCVCGGCSSINSCSSLLHRTRGCKNPWRRPASGMGACRWRKGGFRPFFEMCTSRCVSVHGLGKIVRRRHFADTRLDSCGGIKHLLRRCPGCPSSSVAVVPKDSGPNVVVVPKDSWEPAACGDGRTALNVVVLPNDRADPAPLPPSPGWNRRRIGWESALRRIVRTSPFCQSMGSKGGFRPDSETAQRTIT